jgi:transcriptional regulator with XRE-family HTH domain
MTILTPSAETAPLLDDPATAKKIPRGRPKKISADSQGGTAGFLFGGAPLFTSERQEREMRSALLRLVEAGLGSRSLIGERMAEARNGWGITQELAAAHLGYETSAQLSMIERGFKPIPLHTLCAAARFYNVSGDYLLGLTSQPEPNIALARSSAHTKRVASIVTASTEAITSAVLRSLGPPELLETLEQGVPAVEKMLAALTRFMDRNHEVFMDMPGGAPVAAAARELGEYLDMAVTVRERVHALERIGVAGISADAREWNDPGNHVGETGDLDNGELDGMEA